MDKHLNYAAAEAALAKVFEETREYVAAAEAILSAPPNPANIVSKHKDETGYSVYEAWARRCAKAILALSATGQADDRVAAKWCSWCKTDTHNDADCWSTRPAPVAPPDRPVSQYADGLERSARIEIESRKAANLHQPIHDAFKEWQDNPDSSFERDLESGIRKVVVESPSELQRLTGEKE